MPIFIFFSICIGNQYLWSQSNTIGFILLFFSSHICITLLRQWEKQSSILLFICSIRWIEFPNYTRPLACISLHPYWTDFLPQHHCLVEIFTYVWFVQSFLTFCLFILINRISFLFLILSRVLSPHFWGEAVFSDPDTCQVGSQILHPGTLPSLLWFIKLKSI